MSASTVKFFCDNGAIPLFLTCSSPATRDAFSDELQIMKAWGAMRGKYFLTSDVRFVTQL